MTSPVFQDGDLGPDIRRKLNEMGVAFDAAIAGAYGPQGWSAVLALVSDGERRVFEIVDWVGGEDTKPTELGFIGATGIVANIADAVDVRGAIGAQGSTGLTGIDGVDGVNGADGREVEFQTTPTHIQWRYSGGTWGDLIALSSITGASGADGNAGWTPIFANTVDGSRIVQQVIDWVGGEGSKPPTGNYVGASGLVTLITDGVNIRGASGAGSGDVTGSASSVTGNIAVFADGTGKALADGGKLGSAAYIDSSYFATAAQGAKADSAVQPSDLAPVATSGSYADLTGTPSIPAAQVQTDWDAATGLGVILNKPAVIASGATQAEARASIGAGTSNLALGTSAGTALAGDTVIGDVTLTGVQTLTNKTLTGYTETVYTLTGTDISATNGTIQTKTLSENTTFTESLADGQSVILGIAAGAYSITWPSVTWAKVGGSGAAPTLTSTGVNWIVLWQVGGVVRGSFLGTA